MSKIKNKILDWLAKFLPAYAKEKYKEEVESLRKSLEEKEIIILQQDAYISGMEKALRYKQVIVKSEVK